MNQGWWKTRCGTVRRSAHAGTGRGAKALSWRRKQPDSRPCENGSSLVNGVCLQRGARRLQHPHWPALL